MVETVPQTGSIIPFTSSQILLSIKCCYARHVMFYVTSQMYVLITFVLIFIYLEIQQFIQIINHTKHLLHLKNMHTFNVSITTTFSHSPQKILR